MTIGKKLYLLASINVLLMLVVSVIGFYGIATLNPETSTLFKNLTGVRDVLKGDMMHDALRGDALRSLLIVATKSDQFGTIDEVLADVKDHGETFESAMKEAEALGLGKKSQDALGKVQGIVQKYITSTDKLVHESSTNYEQAVADYENFQKVFTELEDEMEATSTAISEEAESNLQADIAMARFLRNLLIVTVICAALLAAFVSYSIVKGVVSSITRYVQNLTKTSKVLQHQAHQMTDTSQLLGSGSSEQAAAIQETVASIAEMLSMLQQTNEYSKQSMEVATNMGEKTDHGGRIMSKLASSMESIQNANAQLAEIAQIIEQISSKTAVINDIVFKTQLLSFNASIEAARAGQHGRGFAVVAEEVGNLADMSGNSAREIQSLLDESRKQVAHIVESVQKRVLEGEQVTGEALTIFGEIARESNNISTYIHKIGDATREQETGVQQISVAMSQMDNSAQRNNSVATDISRGADELQNQGRDLSKIVVGFSKMIIPASGHQEGSINGRKPTQIIELDHDIESESAHAGAGSFGSMREESFRPYEG